MRATEELSVSAGTARGQHPASRDRIVAGASVVTSGAVLGLNLVLLKVALRAAGPMTIQALATALTALFFGSYLLLRRTRPSLRRRDFTWAVVAALLVGVGGSSATAFGVQRIAAGTTALILATTPILTLIVRAVLLRNRPEVTKIVGCGLGLCGVATIVWGSAGGGRSQLMGSLLVLLAALLWALALVVMREKLASVPAPTVVAWQMIASAPVLLVVALATERLNVHWSPAFLGAVVYLGLAGKGLSFLFQMIAVSRASDLLASSTAFLTPAFGVLFAAGILAERIGKAEVAGVGVIFVGLAAITFGTPQAKAGPLGRIRSCGRGTCGLFVSHIDHKEETLTPLRRVPLAELSGKAAEKWRTASASGADLSFLAVLGSAPHVTDFYYGDFYQGLFFAGTVPVRLKELARLRLAGVHGCVPCQSLDVQSALAHGVSEAEIAAVWSPDTASFSEPERSVLELADAMSFASYPAGANDELLARLQQHLTDDQIVELAMVCAVLTGAAKMLLTLGLVNRSIRCDITAGATAARTHPSAPQSP